MKTALSLCLGLWFATTLPARAADETGKAAKPGPAYEVESFKDIAYYDGKDADPVKHKLDVYRPKGRKGFPVVFFVHGGTWRSGDKRLYPKLGEVLAGHGIGTVITNYRLSPKVKHPAHIEDVARAFAWTHKHVAEYGGRPDQIFAVGHSAGGHLVALLATDEKYLKAHGLTFAAIKGIVPMSGVYTIAPYLFKSQFGNDPQVCKDASPLAHVTGQHPPCLVIYAEKDFPLLDIMAENFCKELGRCKCEAGILKVQDRDHITIIVKMADNGDPTLRALVDFVNKHKGAKPAAKGK